MKEKMEKEINNLIKICHSNLKNSKSCLEYLKEERGLSDEVISQYQIGFFPQNISKLTDYVSRVTLEKINIIDFSGGSEFVDYFYLIFPIFSEYNEAIGIGGRTLLNEQQRSVLEIPKYKNSSFKKANFLFGLNKARGQILKNRNVYVSEGYFDQIAMNSNGFPNTVAICGTAFSKNHFLKLARYTDKITFVLDSDDGGRKSMERICLRYANRGIKLRFLLLPKEFKDIDQYFREGGSRDSFVRDLKFYIPNW